MIARSLCFAAALAMALCSYAQLMRSYISGTVLDPSGASVAGVKVTANHQATNQTRDTITNDYGFYRFAGLEPGVYTLEFSEPRFQTTRTQNIRVDSTQETVVDQKLALAQGLLSTVVVTAVPEGIELSKTSAAIDRTIDSAVMEKVPLAGTQGREITNLMALGPSVVRVPAKPEFNYVAAGQRQGRTEFLADGLDNRSGLDFALWRPAPEQVAEFQVKTNAYSAEFGRTSGVVVSIVSRSGGNRWNGALWHYYSANWMSAQTLQNKRAGLALPRFQEHHAGASIGGPLRRDRTFVFGVFQARPTSSGPSAALAIPVTIPTAAGYEALSWVPLGFGQTAEGRQAVLSTLGFLREVYPLVGRYQGIGATNVNGTPIEVGTTQLAAPNQSTVLTGMTRLDHQLTRRDNLTFRWQTQNWHEDISQGGRASLSNPAFGALFSAKSSGATSSGFASHTRILGPSAVNEFRFGAARNPFHSTPAKLAGPYVFTPAFSFGAIPFTPFGTDSLNLQWQDVLTMQRGRHALKMGADFLRLAGTLKAANFTRGLWIFPGLQDLLNNLPVLLKYQRETLATETRQLQQAYFFQDDYRALRNLTVNFGLRYQSAGTPLSAFGVTAPELLSAGLLPPVRRDTNDWAPRFGFAWSPTERTVLRGGFGIAYEQTPGPPQATGAFTDYPKSIGFSLFPPSSFGLYPNIPQAGPATPPLLPQFYDFVSASPDAKSPTTHFYSFSVQRQLGRSQFMEAGFTGNRAYHLWRFNERNPLAGAARVNPAWASRNIGETAGFSNYNSGYVRFERRTGSGLLVGMNYGWSATLDDSEGPPQDSRNYRREYGRADIDRPHRLAAHLVWTTPSLSRAHRFLNQALGGWQIAGYGEWQSGEPFTVTTGVDSNGDGVAHPAFTLRIPDRPDFTPSGILSLDSVTNNWRSFRTPIDGTGIFRTPLSTQGLPLAGSMPFGGNLGRNTFRGPAYADTHVSLLKEFVLGERARLELRASWTNFLNHRNFGPPVAAMNSPSFGTNQSNPDARVTILALKVRF